jgi:hypothetical protein
MESVLTVVGAVLAGFAVLDALRSGGGVAERLLRVVGGGSLLVMAVVALENGASAAALLSAAVGVPLVAGSALPWVFSRMPRLQANRHGNARAHQP